MWDENVGNRGRHTDEGGRAGTCKGTQEPSVVGGQRGTLQGPWRGDGEAAPSVPPSVGQQPRGWRQPGCCWSTGPQSGGGAGHGVRERGDSVGLARHLFLFVQVSNCEEL